MYSKFEVFHVKEKQIPVDSIEIKGRFVSIFTIFTVQLKNLNWYFSVFPF